MVFVIAAFTLADLLRGTDELYGPDPFHHLEAKLVFNPQAQRGAMERSQRGLVHFIGQQRQRMTGVL